MVGPGYLWLTGSVVALAGVISALAGASALAYVATGVAIIAALLARHPGLAAGGFAVAALLFGVTAGEDLPALSVITGALLLGGITSDMMLGHWYLVDPRLPRWPLRTLAAAAAAGLAADAIWAFAADGLMDDTILGATYLALVVLTALLITGVWFSLGEPRYSGVMAATGLSYLAVLTSFGVATVGRALTLGGP